jgi:hypothetical protein
MIVIVMPVDHKLLATEIDRSTVQELFGLSQARVSQHSSTLEVLNSLSGVSIEEREKCKALLEGLASVWISRLSVN